MIATDRQEIASTIQQAMVAHALPDSRFGIDHNQFIPGFNSSDIAAAALVNCLELPQAGRVFVTPDNSLQPLRAQLLALGMTLVLPTYGLLRGFLVVEPDLSDPSSALYRSWLEGAEHFGEIVSLSELRSGPVIDFVFAGAAAVSNQGVRFGMGATYLDIEWPMLVEAGVVSAKALVATVVHDVQVFSGTFERTRTDVLVDVIATPSRLIRTENDWQPDTLNLDIVSEEMRKSEPISQLLALRSRS